MEFDAQTNSMFFDLKLLQMETLGSDRQVADIVYSYLEAEISKVEAELSLETSVAVVIGKLLPSGQCSFDLVSKAVGLNPKTLQRRLSEAGTSYGQILEDERHKTAIRLLSETDIPAAKVAILCGYGSAGAFNLAFKGWQQMTPGEFRNRGMVG